MKIFLTTQTHNIEFEKKHRKIGNLFRSSVCDLTVYKVTIKSNKYLKLASPFICGIYSPHESFSNMSFGNKSSKEKRNYI